MTWFVRGVRDIREGYLPFEDPNSEFSQEESQKLQEEVLSLERALKNAPLVEGCLYNFAHRKDFLLPDCQKCSPANYVCATCELKTPVNVKKVGDHFIMSSDQTSKGIVYTNERPDYNFQEPSKRQPECQSSSPSLPSRMTLGLKLAR